MGVKVLGATYTNPYTAGTTSFLKGNTLEWLHVVIEMDVSVKNVYTQSSSLSLVSDNILINLDDTDWKSQGFKVGDTITIHYEIVTVGVATFVVNENRVILDLQGNKLVYDSANVTNPFLTTIPGQTSVDDGTSSNTYVTLFIEKVTVSVNRQPQALSFEYGLIPNLSFASENLSSFVDGTKRLYEVSGIEAMTPGSTQSLTVLGKQSGLAIENELIRYVSVNDNVYKFKIEFDILINSLFDSDLNGIENNVFPDVLLNSESLTDNFKAIWMPENGNPNIFIENDMQLTKQLGNVGWKDESFNGGIDNFTVDSITYEDLSANVLTELDYASSTIVKATISGVANLVIGTTSFGLVFVTLPKIEKEFKDLNTGWHENLYVNTCGVAKKFNLVANAGAFDTTTYDGFTKDNAFVSITDIRFQIGSDSSKVEVQFTVIPNAAFGNKFDLLTANNRSYALYVSCADQTLNTSDSDRVPKQLDVNFMQKAVVQLGEYPGLTNSFIANYENNQDAGDANLIGLPQDNYSGKIGFTIDTSEDISINAITFKFEAVETSSGIISEMENNSIDLSSEPLDGAGVPQFNIQNSRGFKLNSSDDKNDVHIIRNPALDSGSEFGYAVNYGFRIRYEDWINRDGLANDFFDSNELENGFNNDWFHKFDTAGYEFRFVIEIGATVDGVTGVYRNLYAITLKDYNDNSNITITERTFRQSDNTSLPVSIDSETGLPLLKILQGGEITRYEADFEIGSGTWSSLPGTYFELQIEEDLGGGTTSVFLLSTKQIGSSDSPIFPLDGETLLKKELITPEKITISCLIDGSKLITPRYRISPEVKGLLSADVEKYLNFNGTDERVECGNNASLSFDISSSFTLCGFIKPDDFTLNRTIMGKDTGFAGGSRGYFLVLAAPDLNKLSFQIRDNGGERIKGTGNTSIPLGVFTFVALTYTGTGLLSGSKLYVGTTLQTLSNTQDNLIGTILSNSDFVLGDFTSGGAPTPYKGGLDKMSVWSKALSQAEITEIEGLGQNRNDYSSTSVFSDLISLWEMDEFNAIDSEGTNNGTGVNMDVTNEIVL